MIIYLIKSTLLLGLLFGLYKLLLENEKIHYINRFFLLFALSFGLTAPLVTFDIYPEQTIAGIKMQQMERVVNRPAEAVSQSVETAIAPESAVSTQPKVTQTTATETGWPVSTTGMLLAFYGLITLVLLIRFASGLLEIRKKIKNGSQEEAGPATLVLLDEPITPQSFFQFIFLGKESFKSGEIEREILEHELTHVRQFHSLDVLFIELLKVIFWFNPFMYLYKHAIQLNHEFIADESVLSETSSVSDYQNMLIRACGGNKPMKTTSSISFSLTKKRMRMMVRSYSPFRSGSKSLLLMPLLALLVLTFCSKESENYEHVPNETYSDIELHFDAERSQELGIPPTVGAHFTSSGELFTGTQKIYYTENDSLYMEMYFEDGINTGSRMTMNGDVIRQVRGVYRDSPYAKEMYRNGSLTYKDIPPTESEDEMGYVRMWHDNGQLSFEVSYTGDKVRQGLMTEYDEDGNITKQERYKDGELVEKIK